LGPVRVSRGRHRDQYAVEVRYDVDADDLRAAGLSDAGSPGPLSTLSPWLDLTVVPLDETLGNLDRQQHRRFVKTHTPLDGVPIDERANYIVVARDPRDMAISLFHQSANMNRARVRELLRQPEPESPSEPSRRLGERDALLDFIGYDGSPVDRPDTLVGVAHHLGDAWARRREPNILLVHYADLSRDLEGAMRWLATRLGIEVEERRWSDLVNAASFAQMRERATRLVPDSPGILLDHGKFFRAGTSDQWRQWLTDADRHRYDERVAQLVEPELAAWMHGGCS
jgi:aryl sulfotransferase